MKIGIQVGQSSSSWSLHFSRDNPGVATEISSPAPLASDFYGHTTANASCGHKSTTCYSQWTAVAVCFAIYMASCLFKVLNEVFPVVVERS